MCHDCGKSLYGLSQEDFDELSGKLFAVRLGDNCKSRRNEVNKIMEQLELFKREKEKEQQ